MSWITCEFGDKTQAYKDGVVFWHERWTES